MPLKITSAISPPRSALADCSPSTQRIASSTFDLPQPFGPDHRSHAAMEFRTVCGANDLKPIISRDLKIHEESFSLRCREVYGLLEASLQEKTPYIVVAQLSFINLLKLK